MGKRKLLQEEILELFYQAHGTTYDYSLVNYINDKTKVDILCRVHGKFSQSPAKHKRGQGCSLCRYVKLSESKFSTKEEFVGKAKNEQHTTQYSYNKVVYVDSTTPVEIFCNTHQISFWQTPAQHLTGSGCPACAQYGYRTNKPGSIYVLVSDGMCKVGITNRLNEARANKINRTSSKNFSHYFKVNFGDGSVPRKIEKKILLALKKLYKQPVEKFDGSTECFIGANPETIVKMIVEEASRILG